MQYKLPVRMFTKVLLVIALIVTAECGFFDSEEDVPPAPPGHDHDHGNMNQPSTPKFTLQMRQQPKTNYYAKFRTIQEMQKLREGGSRSQYLAGILEQFASSRLPAERDNKQKVRDFITDWFHKHGLEMEQNKFTVSINYDQLSEKYDGVNILGVIPGRYRNTPQDEVLAVIAHYDTGAVVHGLSDNGAGVAALLETARELMTKVTSQNLQLDKTVYFAALDYQISEYPLSPQFIISGEDGTSHFLNYLDPSLFQSPTPRVTGIFLDSILMYNPSTQTQTAPGGLSEELPGEYTYIANSNYKGTFLTMVSMDTRGNSKVEKAINNYWTQAKNRYPDRKDFDLRSWPLAYTNFNKTQLHKSFSKQGQQHFWFHTDQYRQLSPLPAVLLTDTGDFRTEINFCLPNCTDLEKRFPNQIHFLGTTVDTLVNTISELQGSTGESTTPYPVTTTKKNGGSTVLPSAFLFLAISVFYMVQTAISKY